VSLRRHGSLGRLAGRCLCEQCFEPQTGTSGQCAPEFPGGHGLVGMVECIHSWGILYDLRSRSPHAQGMRAAAALPTSLTPHPVHSDAALSTAVRARRRGLARRRHLRNLRRPSCTSGAEFDGLQPDWRRGGCGPMLANTIRASMVRRQNARQAACSCRSVLDSFALGVGERGFYGRESLRSPCVRLRAHDERWVLIAALSQARN
jgi:hypothetical protein